VWNRRRIRIWMMEEIYDGATGDAFCIIRGIFNFGTESEFRRSGALTRQQKQKGEVLCGVNGCEVRAKGKIVDELLKMCQKFGLTKGGEIRRNGVWRDSEEEFDAGNNDLFCFSFFLVSIDGFSQLMKVTNNGLR
jgi:hypothetical protein